MHPEISSLIHVTVIELCITVCVNLHPSCPTDNAELVSDMAADPRKYHVSCSGRLSVTALEHDIELFTLVEEKEESKEDKVREYISDNV